MKLFNIIKPDMLADKESLRFYIEHMKKYFNIDIQEMYYIKDWVRIAKLIYELDLQTTQKIPEKIIEKRKQLLVTILGYHTYYKDQNALVALYNAPTNRENILQELNTFKKELREIFVNRTDKHYIRIINEFEIDYCLPLEAIDLSMIQTEITVVPYHIELLDSSLKMAFFNRLHFPNSNIEEITNELTLLRNQGILEEKNRVKRLEI